MNVFAIVNQTSPSGQVPIEEFRAATDAAAAVTAFAAAPPQSEEDFLAHDTGQETAPVAGAGMVWAYDFDIPGLVQVGAPYEYAVRQVVRIVEGEQQADAIAALTPNWETLGAVTAQLDEVVPDLANAIGRFRGDFQTDATGCKARLIEDPGEGTEVVLKSATLPNTSGAWKRDASVDTDPDSVPLSAGPHRYALQVQIPSALVVLKVRDALFALIERSR